MIIHRTTVVQFGIGILFAIAAVTYLVWVGDGDCKDEPPGPAIGHVIKIEGC